MGLMTVLENRIAELEDPSNTLSDFDPWRAPKTAAGPRVTTDNAKANTAVFAAIKTISNSIAALPIKLYQRNPDGSKNEVREHPSWDVAHNAANDRMTAADFKSWGQGHLLTRGNLYAEVTKNGRGQTDGLFLLNPDRMDVRLSSDGETVVYIYRPDDGQQTVFMGDEVLHIKGMGGNSLVGWSPIEVAREAISHGLAIQEFSARFFGNSSQPSGILTTPNSLSKEASQRLKQQWEEAQSGLENAHRVAVLEEGLSWEQMGLSARDSQLIQSEKLGWRKVAQIFGIPPHKIGDLEDATFSNISEQNLEYLQDTLQPWIVRWEQALNRTLLTRRERRERGLFFEFVMDALLRGDSSERANMIETRMQTGTWTINEVREMENEDPLDVPGADEPMVQMQMVPISQAVSMSPDERTRMIAAANGEPVEERSEKAETRQTPDFRLALRGSFHGMILDRMETMVGREANDIDRFAERLLVEHDPEAFVEAIQSYYLTGRGDSGEFVEMARDLVSPVFDSYVDAVSAATARELDEEEPDLADFADDYTQGFIRRYAASSRRQLQKLAREAAQSSEERQQDLEELTPREAVEERTDEWREGTDTRKPRAEKWTDRESVQLGEATAKTAMAAVGVQLIRWMSVGDSCPYCKALDGTVVGVRKNFIEEGGRFDAPDADTPLQVSSAIGHPPLHPGGDCTIVVEG